MSRAAGAERLGAALAAELAERGAGGARLAIVCGSGLGALEGLIEDPRPIPFEELAAMPGARARRPGVPGHAGRFVRGTVAGVPVLLQAGRLHLYEGWSAFDVALPVRAFARLGLETVLLTNAAGGLRPELVPGSLVALADHLNLQGRSALLRSERRAGASPYDPLLRRALVDAGRAAGVPVVEGLYAALLGPAYETAAEIRALARLGADAVGMSTVVEASAARAAGLAVAALSLITNPATGLGLARLAHDEVLAAGRAATERLQRLLRSAVPALAP